jgi:Flp pilus assembly protein TadB
VGVSLEDIVIWKLLGPLVCLGVCAVGGIALSSMGMPIPMFWVIPVVGAFFAVGFVLPDVWVKARAKRNRMTFLFSFSSFLDLTNVLLSGGAGMETALIAASEAGDGVAYAKIREALTRARSTHRSPWHELQKLGDTLGLEVVSEVGASIQLAGEHGARVRSSLAKRAEPVRHKQSAEVEAAANAATERMGLPMVLLFLGFLVLIGYPAADQMLQGL